MAKDIAKGTTTPDGTDRLVLKAGDDGSDSLLLPNTSYVTDAAFIRDGNDLILEIETGQTLLIEDYFLSVPPPTLTAPGGVSLFPSMVEAFLQAGGALHYATASSNFDVVSDISPVGLIREITGEATVTRVDGTTEPLILGAPIYQGDIIETGADDAVDVVFVDDSSFAVSNNARLAIDEYVYDPSNGTDVSHFSLLRGVFIYTSGLIGRDDPDDVEIETPIGSIGIRGTVIAGTINPGGESHITVMEGAIIVRNNVQLTTLSEQFQTVYLTGDQSEIVNIGIAEPATLHDLYGGLKDVASDIFVTFEDGYKTFTEEQEGFISLEPEEMLLFTPAITEGGFLYNGVTESPSSPLSLSSYDSPTAYPPLLDSTATSDTLTPTETTAAETDLLTPEDTNSQTQDYFIDPAILDAPSTNNGTTGSVSAPPPLQLNSLSATDGVVLAGASGERLGYSLSAWGDKNGDGFADMLLTNHQTNGGDILLLDGQSQTLANISSVPGSPSLTPTLAAAGDIDGDGQLDFVMGAPQSDNIVTDGGNVAFYSGSSPIFVGQSTGDALGHSVAGIGDINQDGLMDVLVGAPGTNGSGAGYIIFGASSIPSISLSDNNLNGIADFQDSGLGFAIEGLAANDLLGFNSSGAGDFNNDGFDDFMISEPGQNRVHLAFGQDNVSDVTLGTDTIEINNIALDGSSDIPLFQMGDVNGDGISDIGIGAKGFNSDGDAAFEGAFYILYGDSAANASQNIDLAALNSSEGFYITASAGTSELVAGGRVGDFNGDGFDDIAVAFRDGGTADIYVVYGEAGATNITNASLTDPSAAFHMQYDLSFLGNPASDPFNFVLESAGDVNGDGFDDLAIGTPDANGGDGGVTLVYGGNDSAVGADGVTAHIAGQTTASNSLAASGSGQHLIGDSNINILDTARFNNLTLRGGAGDDIFNIDSTFRSLDGGSGFDTLNLLGNSNSLDFTNLGSEALSGIEQLVMQDASQSLKLGLDDIFSLLQGSSDGTLRLVDNSGGNTSVTIDDNGSGSGTWAGNESSYGFTYAGTDTTSEPGISYDIYTLGSGYKLLIDQNIDAVNVA